jgi:hypothetical protein
MSCGAVRANLNQLLIYTYIYNSVDNLLFGGGEEGRRTVSLLEIFRNGKIQNSIVIYSHKH